VVRAADRVMRLLMRALAYYSLLVVLVALVDWLRHPLALSPYAAFEGHPAFRAFALFVGAPLTAVIGALIIRRDRENIVGWLILSAAGGVGSFAISVEIEPLLLALVSLPIPAWWMALIFLPYYFPDGRAYPRWLSPFTASVMLLALFLGLAGVVAPPETNNATASQTTVAGAQAVFRAALALFTILTPLVILGVFVSPWLRYRRAGYVQRQQIKWFAWWAILIFVPYLIFYFYVTFAYPNRESAPPALALPLSAAIGLIWIFPPVIIGLAILRHRLYDIDLIIRKTLLYTLLSALLAVVYLGSVLVLQSALGRFAGEQSPLIIILSTLLIAALFSPLRRRLQAIIDRRFFRPKYDEGQVLAELASATRDEVKVEELTIKLAGLVEATMRPATVSVWLKGDQTPGPAAAGTKRE
jgi:hypothetical protein